jgi:hypothetical protein
MLMVIVVVSGQQISFIPNGAHFANPGGTSQTYNIVGKGIDLKSLANSFRFLYILYRQK